ncbi:MAG: peptidase dimerization domain-containing protein, partial [Patescibacteria group bacterium]
FDFTDYKYLLNLDSEKLGEVCIGCAGGNFTNITLPIHREPVKDKKLVRLDIYGLLGGHSGQDIHKGRFNAIKVMVEILRQIENRNNKFSIVDFEGGAAANRIPDEAFVTLAVDTETAEKLLGEIEHEEEYFRRIAAQRDESVELKIDYRDLDEVAESALTTESSRKVIDIINYLPSEPISYSEEIPGLVQTSTNLGKVQLNMDRLEVRMLSRSSNQVELEDLNSRLTRDGENYGASLAHEDPFPGWDGDSGSEIVSLVKAQYEKLTGSEMDLDITHAGVECGALLQRPQLSHMQAVSFGPTIEWPHTVKERVNISSIDTFYKLLKGIVGEIATQSR